MPLTEEVLKRFDLNWLSKFDQLVNNFGENNGTNRNMLLELSRCIPPCPNALVLLTIIMIFSKYRACSSNFLTFGEYKNERKFIEAYKFKMLTFIRKDKNLGFEKIVPKKYIEMTNNVFQFCGDDQIAFDGWYGYIERQFHSDVTDLYSQLLHWNGIMMHIPDVDDYVEKGSPYYGINRGAFYRIVCLLFELLDSDDKVHCESFEERLWFIYVMIEFELFSREKILFLYHNSVNWDLDATAKPKFVRLVQDQIEKDSIKKCKEHVKKHTKDNINHMLNPNQDVKDIVRAFREEFEEDFLIHHDEHILNYIAYY